MAWNKYNGQYKRQRKSSLTRISRSVLALSRLNPKSFHLVDNIINNFPIWRTSHLIKFNKLGFALKNQVYIIVYKIKWKKKSNNESLDYVL